MATDLIIDTANRLLRITYTGRVTIAEMYERRSELMSDPTYDPGFAQLIDARAVTTFELNGYSMKQYAQEHAAAAGARRAIVMSRAPDLGLARLFQIYRELAGGKEETQIFNDMGAAERWLGVPGEPRWK